jgi:hypothetical protein
VEVVDQVGSGPVLQVAGSHQDLPVVEQEERVQMLPVLIEIIKKGMIRRRKPFAKPGQHTGLIRFADSFENGLSQVVPRVSRQLANVISFRAV